ncbi:MAG: EAL domain-containing protein [Cyanobacteria bacterium P01_D01_bin.156]
MTLVLSFALPYWMGYFLDGWLGPIFIAGWELDDTLQCVMTCSLAAGAVVLLYRNFFLDREIKQRKIVEARLQASEERYASLANTLLVGVFCADASGQVVYVNPHYCKIVGMPAASVARNGWSQALHPDDRERVLTAWFQTIQTDQPFDMEYRFVHADGTVRWVYGQCIAERDPYGQVSGYIGTLTDISDRKRSEESLKQSEAHYRALINALPDLIMRVNRAGIYLEFLASPEFQVLGNLTDWVGLYISHQLPSDLAKQRLEAIQKALESQSIQIYEQTLSIDGHQQIEQVRVVPYSHDEVLMLVQDITEQRQSELALQQSETHNQAILKAIPDLMFRVGADGCYREFISEPRNFSLFHNTTLTGQHMNDLLSPELAARQLNYLRKTLQTGDVQIYEQQIQNGDCHQYEEVRVVRSGPDEVLFMIRDISDRVNAEERLKHDMYHDDLTGLPNRSLLMERLALALKRTKRRPQTQFAVLFLDLDNFKVVNDSLGHLVGDELLLKVSTQLKLLTRETDLAARLGGDEFVLLLEEINDVSEAVMVAERILKTLQVPIKVGNHKVFSSASIGIVLRSEAHKHPTDLLRDADSAMYWAKHNGRARYAIFSPDMHQQAMKRLQIENDLRKALDNKEFVLYYQPIVDLETLKIKGFESLIRWRHPQRGLVFPNEFIDISEDTGLIIPIGQWILHQACRQLAVWQAQFPDHDLSISVNLSVKQLQTSLLQELEAVMTQYGLRQNSLILEITESMLVENVEAMHDLLNQIRAQGICLSIDDFGTGYSSLRYLHQLPVNALKIDRAFVNLTKQDTRNQVIAESVIALSNLLQLSTVAEGIETLEQCQWLKMLGCSLGQGFLFSQPVPTKQATELLKQGLTQQIEGTELLPLLI